MDNPLNRTCGECRFFRALECRRFPRQLVIAHLIPTDKMTPGALVTDLLSTFPGTAPNYPSCGEFSWAAAGKAAP